MLVIVESFVTRDGFVPMSFEFPADFFEFLNSLDGVRVFPPLESVALDAPGNRRVVTYKRLKRRKVCCCVDGVVVLTALLQTNSASGRTYA